MMSLQINSWLLLFGGLQGLLLSLVLVRKKTYRHGYCFLIAYLLVMIGQILFKVADKQWLMEGSRTTYFLSYKFPFLYGPLIYLFTRQLIDNSSKFSGVVLLHFLPFIYSISVLNLIDARGALSFLYFPLEGISALVFQIGSLLIYHTIALRLWQQHNRTVQRFSSDLPGFKTKWIEKFIFLSGFICIAISLLTYFIYIWYPAHNWLRFGFLLLGLFIYWISYSAIQQSDLFNGYTSREINQQASVEITLLPAVGIRRPVKKYANSGLTDEEAARIMLELESAMRKQKLFAETDLTIEQLASSLHTNRYVLSQVLNERLKQSFYEYINGWRVKAAKEMLDDPAFQLNKIAAIGYDAGFNSLSTFNEVFKKITGVTPSQYKKQGTTVAQKLRL